MSNSSSPWVRGRSRQVKARHESKSALEKFSGIIFAVLVLTIGLVYVSQGTKATGYDYEISKIEDEIAELEAKKEDLAVERARLTSIARVENSEVAARMETAGVSGYAAE